MDSPPPLSLCVYGEVLKKKAEDCSSAFFALIDGLLLYMSATTTLIPDDMEGDSTPLSRCHFRSESIRR